MDHRVSELLHGLSNSKNIEPLAARNQISDLFSQVNEEEDRVSLLQAFHAVMALALRSLEAQGRDTSELRNAIIADRRRFALEEAMVDGGNVDPVMLNYVVEREVAAGRMERDSFGELSEAGAKVLGQRSEEPKRGFFGRLFGG